MKKLSSLLLFFMLLGTFSLVASTSYAQVVVDTAKSGSKISIWAGKQKETAQKAMDWVANSKVGKLVGDGVKAAKDGIKFAKEAVKSAKQAIKDAKNSPAYKSAMLSKDIGEASMNLKDVSKDLLGAKDEYEEQVASIKQVAEGKIQALQSNIPVTEEYLKQKAKEGDAVLDVEMDANSNKNKGALDSIQRQMEADIAKAEIAYTTKKDSLESQVIAKTKKVADLTKELGEVNNVKVDIPDPMKAMNDTKDKMFLKVGEVASIKNTQNKKDQRYRHRREVLYKAYEKSLQQKLELEDMRADAESVADLVDTMSGTSDVSGISVEVLLKQAEFLKVYVDFVVTDLKREATTALATLPVESKSIDKGGKFNLDNYKSKKAKSNPLAAAKGMVDKGKETAGKVKDSANKVKDKVEGEVNKVKDKIDEVNAMKEEAKGVVGGASDMIDAAKDAAGNPSAFGGMGI